VTFDKELRLGTEARRYSVGAQEPESIDQLHVFCGKADYV